MKKHKIAIEPWASEGKSEIEGQGPTVLRWRCSCGRIGPALPLEGTLGGRARAERRADTGGRQHIAAMERVR